MPPKELRAHSIPRSEQTLHHNKTMGNKNVQTFKLVPLQLKSFINSSNRGNKKGKEKSMLPYTRVTSDATKCEHGSARCETNSYS